MERVTPAHSGFSGMLFHWDRLLPILTALSHSSVTGRFSPLLIAMPRSGIVFNLGSAETGAQDLVLAGPASCHRIPETVFIIEILRDS